jgi:hypothetical protein
MMLEDPSRMYLAGLEKVKRSSLARTATRDTTSLLHAENATTKGTDIIATNGPRPPHSPPGAAAVFGFYRSS